MKIDQVYTYYYYIFDKWRRWWYFINLIASFLFNWIIFSVYFQC